MKGLEICRAYFEEYGLPMLKADFPDLLPVIAVGLSALPDRLKDSLKLKTVSVPETKTVPFDELSEIEQVVHGKSTLAPFSTMKTLPPAIPKSG